jgi:S-adenosylmethionine hydrolase
VTNAADGVLEGDPADWMAELGGAHFPLCGTYAEVASGELLALLDSFGYWEVAARDGDAARRLAVGVGAPVVFRRRR